MVATYTVKEARIQNMKMSGTADAIQCSFNKVYDIEVAGVAGADVDVFHMQENAALPKANLTMWETGGKINPFLICRDVSFKQNRSRLLRWEVTTGWKGKYAPLESKPAAITDISPEVTIELGEMQRVMYADKDNVPILTPTGNWYEEPAMERIATQILTIKQYENYVSYDEMAERKFTTNKVGYRGKAIGSWLIEQIEGHEVDVQLSGGTTTAALLTYTLLHNPLPQGWKDQRALIDTHYYNSNGDKVEFTEGLLKTANLGYVDEDGNKRDSQTGVPDYQEFRIFDERNFRADFLQV